MKQVVLVCLTVLTWSTAALCHVMYAEIPRGRRVERNIDEESPSQVAGPPEMTSLLIESNIHYRYAKTSVASRLANKADVAKEISFSAILPQGAFISAFHIEIGDKVYNAYVKEKEAANKEYSDAVRQGKTAAKVDLKVRDSNRFTISVNVEASMKVTFNLTYEELLSRRFGVYSHVINIHPGQIVPNLSVLVNIEDYNNLTTLRVPSLRVTNEITPEDGVVNDPLAVIEYPASNKATIRWNPSSDQQKELKADGISGQLVVEYDVERQNNPTQILVSDGYFVHFYAPADLVPLNKHVVFVLDVSGSMQRTKMRQLKEAMHTIFSDLRDGDYFSIASFSTEVEVWRQSRQALEVNNQTEIELQAHEIVRVTPENIHSAKEFVDNLDANGGTNINDALTISLKIVELGKKIFSKQKLEDNSQQDPEPMVIFLTDGQANIGERNTDTIVKGITQKNKHQVSIFSLAFGSDADKNFLKKLSLKNSGFSRLIYEASDAALQLRDFYRQIASPLLANVTFLYEQEQVDNDTLTNIQFNTLFRGSELVVAGKLIPQSETLRGVLTAKSFRGDTRHLFPSPFIVILPTPRNITAPSFMEKLWAYLNIQQLLDKQELEDDSNSTSKNQALALALKYSFVTPLTSLVVVKPNETSQVEAEDAALPSSSSRTALTRMHGSGVPLSISSGSSALFKSRSGIHRSGVRPQSGYSSGSSHQVASGSPDTSYERRIVNVGSPVEIRLNNLSWGTETNNGTHIFVTKNNQTFAYKVGIHQPDLPGNSCNVQNCSAGLCKHLPYCVLPEFTHDFNNYVTSFFCEIDSFAGVCCPDMHRSPVDVSGDVIPT